MSRLARRQFLTSTGGFLATQSQAFCRAGESATEVAPIPPGIKTHNLHGEAVIVNFQM